MDALVLVRSISFTISIIGAIYYRASTSYRRYISPNSYRNKRYVRWQALLLSPIIDFDQLEQTEASLCLLSDEDIVKWKDSYVSICNTVGVAGAIFGQVALTALSLPGISDIHWIARGSLVVATILGIASVVSGSVRSIALLQLHNSNEIRIWFSGKLDPDSAQRPLKSSLPAQALLNQPTSLLGWAGLTLVCGIGTYLGLIWTENIPSISLAQSDNRNVFILFILSLLPLFTWQFWTTLKDKEDFDWTRKREQLSDTGDFSLYEVVQSLMNGETFSQVLERYRLRDQLDTVQAPPPPGIPLQSLSNIGVKVSAHDIVTAIPSPGSEPPVSIAATVSNTSATNIPQVLTDNQAHQPLRYSLEQLDYIDAVRLAAESRRQSAEVDKIVASRYEELAKEITASTQANLVVALRAAAEAHRKTADTDMLVLKAYEKVLVNS